MSQKLYFAFVAVLILGLSHSKGNAGDWNPSPAPILLPADAPVFDVGKGTKMPDGSKVTIQVGEVLSLSAEAFDEDTLTTSSVNKLPDNPANLIWSKSGGTLTIPERSGNTPAQKFYSNTPGTFTIEVRPDDSHENDLTAEEMAPDTGQINDQPGEKITLYITVIDSCPDTVQDINACTHPAAFNQAFWNGAVPAGTYGWGLTSIKVKVAGGTPPADPGNWDGLFISEAIGPFVGDPGNLADGDLNGIGSDRPTKAKICSASSDGFVVGEGQDAVGACNRPKTVDHFWDTYMQHMKGQPLLNTAVGVVKTVNCIHQYKCKNKVLNVGVNNRFKATFSLVNQQYVINGVNTTVTEVSISRVPD